MNFKNFSLSLNLLVSSVFITQISLDYFSRQTVTSFEPFVNSSTPGISLCFKESNGLRTDFSSSIKDILSNWNNSELIESVEAGDEQMSFGVTKFLRFQTLCVKLEFLNTTPKSPITITLNKDLLSDVNCLIHSNKFPTGSYPAHKFERNHRENSEQIFNHVIEVRRSLSRRNPKFSNCVDSVKSTSEECLENCISNSSRTVLMSIALGFRNDTRFLTKSASPSGSHCLKKCSRIPCEEEIFEITTRPAKSGSDYKITVILLEPSNMITFIPKMPEEMYLIYITAIIGGTFGFNTILLIDWIQKLQTGIHRACCKTKDISRRFVRVSIPKLIIYSLSLAGYLYQVLEITLDYANHEIIKETYFGPPYRKKAPAFSVCVDPTDLLKPDLKLDLCLDLEDPDGKQQCDSYLKSLTFSQLDNATESLWSIILYMLMVPLQSKALVLDNKNISNATHNPVSTFFKDNRKCFKITPSDPLQTKVAIYLSGTTSSSIHLYLHDARDYPRVDDFQETIVPNAALTIRYAYLLKSTQLLPAPYSSRCRNYTISQAHCLESCIAKQWATKNLFPAYISNPNIDQQLPTNVVDLATEERCEKICRQPDCLLETFEWICNMEISGPVYREVSVHKADLQLTIKWLPKISTNDFIICIIATADLWSGLTIMSLVVTLCKLKTLRRIQSLHHIVKVAIGYLLVIGFLFHATNTVSGYLMRPTVSRTAVVNARHQVAPCIVVGYSWYFENPPGFGMTGNYSTMSLDEKTSSISDIVEGIEIRNASTFEWRTANFDEFHLTTLFFVSLKMTVMCHRDASAYDALALRSTGDTRVLRARTKQDLGTSWLMLTARQQNSLLKVTVWDIKKDTSTSYISYASHLLPWPYSSNCFNYASHGLQSRAVCERRCSIEFVYRTKSYISSYILRDANDTRQPIANEYEDEFWVSKECVRKCSRPDCEDRFLKAFLVSRSVHAQKEFNVEINLGTTTVDTRLFPQHSLLEFIIFFAGLLGMWWGLSLHDAITKSLERFSNILFYWKRSFTVIPDNTFMLNGVKLRVERNRKAINNS